MSQNKRNKIGRNDPCPCGSSLKYKRCHGNLKQEKQFPLNDNEINRKFEELKALNIQREIQQGLGNPIISAEIQGIRCVSVANRMYKGKWKTFHEFLMDYIKLIMGNDWGNKEIQKTSEDMHPLIKIYQMICNYQKTFVTPGEVSSAPFTGAVSAFMWLSYNLYIIAHNAELQAKLVHRLQDQEQFPGAYYETYVAAIFIKAGFTLVFENEADGTTTHCEFTATHKISGKKYSVEAKYRHRENLISPVGSKNFKLGIAQPLHKALGKKADHERIIFIDLNLPASEITKYKHEALVEKLKSYENDPIDGQPAPQAYVFLTNLPYHYDLETNSQALYLMDGFRIPDFGFKKTTLHQAIQSRKKHRPIHDLWESIKTHTTIPSTFDGTLPEFSFANGEQRLKIGEKYIVNAPDGSELVVELAMATVDEVNKRACALCKDSNGHIHMIQFPLSDEEMNAYRRSPDIFFGVYHEQGKRVNSPIELFDFYMKGHYLLTKEVLLERLKNFPDQKELSTKSRDELLEMYCEALAASTYASENNNVTVPPNALTK